MKTILIKNAKIVNEGSIFEGDVLIEGEYIKEIAHHFKKDKWPLSLSSIRSDIITRMIGIDDIAFIASELAKYGINVGYGDIDNNGVLFVDQKKSSTKKKRKGKKK